MNRCRWLTCTKKAFPLNVSEQNFYMQFLLSVQFAAGCTGTSGC